MPLEQNDESIRRIVRMEDIYDRSREAVAALFEAAQAYQNLNAELRELEFYYTSPLWLADRDADAAGLIPRDLKRGILSEDTVYDLLTDEYRLQVLLRQILSEV